VAERTPRKPAAKKPAAKKPAAKKPAAKKAATSRKARRRMFVWASAASVVLVGFLFAFVYPTRTFLDQRSDTNKARAQLSLLRSENDKLEREAKLLQSDAEIERRARQYGLVRPGERPFVIIPAPSTTAPPAAPAEEPAPAP
jgi:cell division protein FtsB